MKSSKRFFLVAAALPMVAACVAQGATSVALAPNAPPSPNLVQLRADPGVETMLGLPHGALTCEATLARADARATCVDVMLRGDYEPRADVALEVDGAPTRWQRAPMAECRMDGPCLPADSHLGRYASDGDPHVQPRGARICFEGAPVGRRRITLRLRQGAMERRFEFRVDPRRVETASR